jgi:hypothetical protein
MIRAHYIFEEYFSAQYLAQMHSNFSSEHNCHADSSVHKRNHCIANESDLQVWAYVYCEHSKMVLTPAKYCINLQIISYY